MAHELDSSAKSGPFNRMYFFILAALVVVVLGIYLFFATTRQAHGTVSGAGTQKGSIATSSDISS